MPAPSPRHEIAHLGHVELCAPEPERSLDFFVRVLGLTENGTDGDSVCLRTWDGYEHHSLKLTAAGTSGVGRTALRATSAEALERRVGALEERGLGVGWEPITWTEAERAKGQAWGLKTIESFHTYGTPPPG